MPNSLHQQADVRVHDRPLGQIVPAFVFSGRFSSTSSSRSSSSAVSSSPVGRRQTESFSLCCRHSSRCHDARESRRSSFQIDTGQLQGFAQQDIIVSQPRHSAAPSCVCGLLCPMLSSVFKLPCCSRRVSQSWRGVERYWSDSSNRSSSSPSCGIERPHRASTDCSALCCRH